MLFQFSFQTWSIFESALKKAKNEDKPNDGNTSKEGKVSTPLQNKSANSVDIKSEKLPNLSPKAISEETTQERLNGHTDQSNERKHQNKKVIHKFSYRKELSMQFI